jgi:hypothetical protein
MTRKRFASLTRVERAAKSGKHMPESNIGFSDVPESTDRELQRARRVGLSKIKRVTPRTT